MSALIPNRPVRRTEELRRGRISAPGARYFITLVTAGRAPWLRAATTRDAFLIALHRWHLEADGRVFAATVMPDHAHILLQLGHRLSVGQIVARCKAELTRSCANAGPWQRDFWEHRVRDDEAWEDYGLYVLLNPYRASLCARNESWPGWFLPDRTVFRFAAALGPGDIPPPEWLSWPQERFAALKTSS